LFDCQSNKPVFALIPPAVASLAQLVQQRSTARAANLDILSTFLDPVRQFLLEKRRKHLFIKTKGTQAKNTQLENHNKPSTKQLALLRSCSTMVKL
jgi:ABC-type uncharacterized transport system permease subunit